MKKIAILSPLVILMASTSLAQDSCIVRPSCADMGYTKTIDDCTGKTTLKCPFDLTAVSCEDEDSSSGGGQWDWENMILCSKLIYTMETNDDDHDIYNYTAPAAGCFFMQDVQDYVYAGVIDSAGTKKIPTIAIGGPFTLCVEKNFIVQGRGYNSQPKCYFIPYKSEVKAKDNSSCEVGDYYFDDDTCSFFNIGDKTAIGVVVDAENRKIISIEKKASLAFASDSSSYTSVYSKITSTTDGKTNTNKLISAGASKFPVAQYCNSMTSGNKAWYVPASNEFTMSSRIASIIGTTTSTSIWTSTPYSSSNVTTLYGYSGTYYAPASGSTASGRYAVCIAKY